MSGMENSTWLTKHLLSQSRYNSYIWLFFPQKIIYTSAQVLLLSIFTVIINAVHFLSQIHILLFYFTDLAKGFRKYVTILHLFTMTLKGNDSTEFIEETSVRAKKSNHFSWIPSWHITHRLVLLFIWVLLCPPLYYTCAYAFISRHHFRDDTGMGHLKRFAANRIFKCIIYAVCISSDNLTEMNMSLKCNCEGY